MKSDLREARNQADGSFDDRKSIVSSVLEAFERRYAALLADCRGHKKAASDIEELMDR